jgi:hypothetical protein
LIIAGVTSGSRSVTPAGGVHGTLGEGELPATPFTLGVPVQLANIGDTPMKMAWRSLLVCDIIPNT